MYFCSMARKLIECVPNFSEGRDLNVIKQITDEIESVDGVALLDVDPGHATNRTVVTFVGEPEPVIEAAFRAIVKASQVIDMSKHNGEHARMGATDVCPLIPVSNMSMEETSEYAHKLGKRVGEQSEIPIYIYGAAQSNEARNDLSIIRNGEYEGFAEKIKQSEWKPDYGTDVFNVTAGATVIGARDFLIAYNINLNTTSTRIANRIAFDVRENGRVLREGNPYTGKIVTDEAGETVREPGSCKAVKAIGWYIDEYKVAQISANLMNYKITSIHKFFDEVEKSAVSRGVRITGSELVGLIPLQALLDAGKHYLLKQGRSIGISEEEIIHIAVKTLGLDELSEFDPQKKIIEYQLKRTEDERLISLSCKAFANETASESMAPGGGSIAAYTGALGASLTSMVANLSANKRGWESRTNEFSKVAVEAQILKDKLLYFVDEDTRSFNGIINALRLPKSTDSEKAQRKVSIEKASQYAADVPLSIMKTANEIYGIAKLMIVDGNPNSVTDAGVAALCARTAIEGAGMNVLVNIQGLGDTSFIEDRTAQVKDLLASSKTSAEECNDLVFKAISNS
jgi:glutamate formiminotransferase / formiminotetrahydrofolate cyclodeaminase